MTDTNSPDTADARSESRQERLAARRRRRTRIIVAIVAVVVVGSAAAVSAVALTQDKPARGATNTPQANSKLGAVQAQSRVGEANASNPTRPLDHAHPLRLWIGGDSLAGSFGYALGDLLGATGIVNAELDYKVSSGLWSNDIRNWQKRAEEQMTSDDPEAVIFIIGTNDTPVVNDVDANHDGEPDWETLYRAKVDHMMDTFLGTGAVPRTVFWLGAPTLGTKSMDRAAAAIDSLVSAEALKRGTNVVYVDTYRLFSGPDGGYSRDIVDENGKTIDARISDGVHFSVDGAQYFARALFALLDARWHLTKQADVAQPIRWTLASGSGESVPGYHYRPRYGSSQQSSSQTTDPPQTVPITSETPSTVATTSPPTTSSPATSPPSTSSGGHTTTSKP